jgi:hypothetical protein
MPSVSTWRRCAAMPARVCLLVLLSGLWILPGCGKSDRPELGEVEGVVTMDGKPLANVIIVFKPEKGRPATGQTNSEGKYTLSYRAGVSGSKVGPTDVSFEYPIGGSGPALPARYSTRSELKAEVKPGRNKLDFALQSGGEAGAVPDAD